MTLPSFPEGTELWIRDTADIWIKVVVVTTREEEIHVRIHDGTEKAVRRDMEFHIANRDEFSENGLVVYDDLTDLTHLHEPALLHALENRFDTDKIYTFTGPILIALNPFKTIDGLYDPKTINLYLGKDTCNTNKSNNNGSSTPSSRFPNVNNPHVFALAKKAYEDLCMDSIPQTVLISGESGAGKTETTKYVMKFLTLVGSLTALSSGVSLVEKRVLESNPILEAFGNAKTLRNNNSSRFGKFIQLQFTDASKSINQSSIVSIVSNSDRQILSPSKGKSLAKRFPQYKRLCGAKISTYLLETVRVCHHQKGERNFHVFYQTCSAAMSIVGNTVYRFPSRLNADECEFNGSQLLLDLRGLSDASTFKYLTRNPGNISLKDTEELEDFELLIKSMLNMGLSISSINEVLNMVSLILNLGNLEFIPGVDGSGNMDDDTSVLCSSVETRTAWKNVLELSLLTDMEDAFHEALTTKTIRTKNEVYVCPITITQASEQVDALARHLYNLLFLRLVHQINEGIGFIKDNKLFIGILDIFGFESFTKNSLEQLCINYANERLQQFFNHFVFKLEEKLYIDEGISWDPLDFPDNRKSVDLLHNGKHGIFAILDEECLVPGGSDDGFCEKLKKKYIINDGRRESKGDIMTDHRLLFSNLNECNYPFSVVPTRRESFVVHHFAGPVEYNSESFLEKNKDHLPFAISDCLKASKSRFISTLFSDGDRYKPIASTSNSRKIHTVSMEFREQVDELMMLIDSTSPHFIRCIKPNPSNKPDIYDRSSICEQLRYGGVLQAVQVSRSGFPVRVKHIECLKDYHELKNMTRITIGSQTKYITLSEKREMRKGINDEINDDDFVVDDINKNKFKFKSFNSSDIDEMNSSSIVEKGRDLLELLSVQLSIPEDTWEVGRTLIFFKRSCFDILSAALNDRKGESAVVIQSVWLGVIQRRKYQLMMNYLLELQLLAKVKISKMVLDLYRKSHAAITIQKNYRMFKSQIIFFFLRKSAIIIQSVYRGNVGRGYAKQYRQNCAVDKLQSTYRCYNLHTRYTYLIDGVNFIQRIFRMISAQRQFRRLQSEAKEVGALLCKFQHAQDQLSETKKRLSEVESSLEMSNAEKRDLRLKDSRAQEMFKEMSEQNSKFKVKVENMEKILAEKQIIIDEFEKELAASKDENEKLKKTALRGSLSHSELHGSLQLSRMPSHGILDDREIDIIFFGSPNSGKSDLIDSLLSKNRNTETIRGGNINTTKEFSVQIRAYPSRFRLRGPQSVEILNYNVCDDETTINDSSKIPHLEFGSKGRTVAVSVFSIYSKASYNDALFFLSPSVKEVYREVFIYGNSKIPENCINGIERQVEQNEAAIECERLGFHFVEGSDFKSIIWDVLEARGNLVEEPSRGILYPSMVGSKSLQDRIGAKNQTDVLRPVKELQDSESAITFIVFGQETMRRAFILLAAASKDAVVTIYKCYRTEIELMELENCMEGEDDFINDETRGVVPHVRLLGHSKAITSIFFSADEEIVVTTSMDKSVRFWYISTGEITKVFTDSSPVPVGIFLVSNPNVLIAANYNAVIRLVNVVDGKVLQKLKVQAEVRALRFDDSGRFLFAGTKSGSIQVLEDTQCPTPTLVFKSKLALSRGSITCINYVRIKDGNNGNSSSLIVNSSDSEISIIDVLYGDPEHTTLTSLRVKHRIKIPHVILPIKSCFCYSHPGYVVSGGEDCSIHVISLGKNENYKRMILKQHNCPVVAVAINSQNTILASADSSGKVLLWRRIAFDLPRYDDTEYEA